MVAVTGHPFPAPAKHLAAAPARPQRPRFPPSEGPTAQGLAKPLLRGLRTEAPGDERVKTWLEGDVAPSWEWQPLRVTGGYQQNLVTTGMAPCLQVQL